MSNAIQKVDVYVEKLAMNSIKRIFLVHIIVIVGIVKRVQVAEKPLSYLSQRVLLS